jgi:hypothetical protein
MPKPGQLNSGNTPLAKRNGREFVTGVKKINRHRKFPALSAGRQMSKL